MIILVICFFFHSAIFIFVLALVGVFYPYNRGALFTALVVIYALTSGIAGYTAASFYGQLEGTNWVCLKRIYLISLFYQSVLVQYLELLLSFSKSLYICTIYIVETRECESIVFKESQDRE